MDDDNPYAAPQAELDPPRPVITSDVPIRRDGKKLLLPEDAQPPLRCVACNGAATIPLKAWVFRGSAGKRMAIRYVLGIGVVVGIVVTTNLLGEFYRPLTFLALVSSSILLNLVMRPYDQIQFTFYICTFHRIVRVASLALMWICILPVILLPWLERHLDIRIPNYDANLPQLLILLGIVLIALQLTGTFVRSAGRRSTNVYRLKGFGKKYLESFPMDDNT